MDFHVCILESLTNVIVGKKLLKQTYKFNFNQSDDFLLRSGQLKIKVAKRKFIQKKCIGQEIFYFEKASTESLQF